jgi:alpha-amylase
VYYGQEHGFNGGFDPWNREALWPSKYSKDAPTYQLIQKLNQLRNHLVATSDWATQPTMLLTTSAEGIAIMKGPVLSIVTNIGSPPQGVSIGGYTPWSSSTATTDVLTCKQYAVGSGGTIRVEYSTGGRPVVLVPNSELVGTGICNDQVETSIGHSAGSTKAAKGGAEARGPVGLLSIAFVVLAATAFALW